MECVEVKSERRKVTTVEEIPEGKCFIIIAGSGDGQMIFKYMKVRKNNQTSNNVGEDECLAVDLEMGCNVRFKKGQEVVPVVAKMYYTQVVTEL